MSVFFFCLFIFHWRCLLDSSARRMNSVYMHKHKTQKNNNNLSRHCVQLNIQFQFQVLSPFRHSPLKFFTIRTFLSSTIKTAEHWNMFTPQAKIDRENGRVQCREWCAVTNFRWKCAYEKRKGSEHTQTGRQHSLMCS